MVCKCLRSPILFDSFLDNAPPLFVSVCSNSMCQVPAVLISVVVLVVSVVGDSVNEYVYEVWLFGSCSYVVYDSCRVDVVQ